MTTEEKIKRILKLKEEKNAIILAHYYQIPEIQDIADFIGDSLNLANKAKDAESDLILFCGVHFMGETAKILNPKKKVIIPDLEAGCSLADSCPEDEFRKFKEKNPDHIVISYINCSAKIKTLSDIICTSGNAVQIVNSIPKEQKIIFAPDKNLGGYINRITGRDMLLWDGTCEVHELLTAEFTLKQKLEHPDAILIAHPECNDAVLKIADYVGSTSAMINYVKNSDNKKFLVATESGIVHQLKKDNPNKEFIVVTQDESCACNDCQYMKLNTIDKVLASLEEEKFEIILNDELIESAKKPIIKMLDISKELGLIK
ncbi:MAG: quinolinate synthase NadA [Bacteroidales bacterium]|jgi:quinolinate synthase|nr:quinolinate synthase NadA [Bacteroidales bacterium]MDD4703182.1 quinolinate synthase NadA [Bacteroidales bacterium]MDX9797829.1 quinolinate synthase NadA [Bacteroidales bacterium]